MTYGAASRPLDPQRFIIPPVPVHDDFKALNHADSRQIWETCALMADMNFTVECVHSEREKKVAGQRQSPTIRCAECVKDAKKRMAAVATGSVVLSETEVGGLCHVKSSQVKYIFSFSSLIFTHTPSHIFSRTFLYIFSTTFSTTIFSTLLPPFQPSYHLLDPRTTFIRHWHLEVTWLSFVDPMVPSTPRPSRITVASKSKPFSQRWLLYPKRSGRSTLL